MSKWTNNGAGPRQCKRFNQAWSKLNWEDKTFTELTGVIGVSEHSSTLTTLVSGGGRADVTEAKERIGNQFAWTVTASNVNQIIAAIEAELPKLAANRPVTDKRETPTARSERDAELERINLEQVEKSKRERSAFIALYGNGETATVNLGQMAVTARICYDNSDSMTDYFDRHCGLSPEFALLVLPKGPETEAKARQGVNVSEYLSRLTFEWHTEKYSMGHGNYLESDGFELPGEVSAIRTHYRGGEVTHGHWEIEFRAAYSEPLTLPAFKGYGAKPAAPVSQSANGVTVSENSEKGGIEIRFPSKPASEVLDTLKANGWRWSRFSGCWYKRASDEARQFAAQFGEVPKREPMVNADDERLAQVIFGS